MTTLFQVGEVVLGKIKGYPYWPAKVIDISQSLIYTIKFFCDNTYAKLSSKFLLKYKDNKNKIYEANKRNKKLVNAMKSADLDIKNMGNMNNIPVEQNNNNNGVILSNIKVNINNKNIQINSINSNDNFEHKNENVLNVINKIMDTSPKEECTNIKIGLALPGWQGANKCIFIDNEIKNNDNSVNTSSFYFKFYKEEESKQKGFDGELIMGVEPHLIDPIKYQENDFMTVYNHLNDYYFNYDLWDGK